MGFDMNYKIKIWNVESKAWVDHIGSQTDLRRGLKPIEKKEMKEYLTKINGSYSYIGYVHADHVSDSMIEIPEGDTWAYKNSRGNIITMHGKVCEAFIGDLVWERESMKEDKITKDYLQKRPDGSYVMKSGFALAPADWIEIPKGMNYAYKDEFNIHFTTLEMGYRDSIVIWQRESPNDKLASAERYRQAKVLPFIDDDFDESNIEQDNVNNPSHYADGEIECIDAIQSSMTHEAFCGYLKGNIQKYIWRYEKKGGIESLKKGQWYLDKLISVL